MISLHQVDAVGILNMDEYLDRKRIQLTFHLDNQPEVFLKKSVSQHYSRYELRFRAPNKKIFWKYTKDIRCFKR